MSSMNSVGSSNSPVPTTPASSVAPNPSPTVFPPNPWMWDHNAN
jgi:hypothetical protein